MPYKDAAKRREYNKKYYKKYNLNHKEQLASSRNRYRLKHKDSEAKYAKEYRKNNGIYFTAYEKNYSASLRKTIIELYSHGTCKCVRCGGEVEELHHTNPEHGLWERNTFNGKSTHAARNHQLEMYTVIPDYITPLCKKCHLKVHKELKTQEV